MDETKTSNFFKSTPFIVFLIAVAIVGLGWYSGLFQSLFSGQQSDTNVTQTPGGEVDFKPYTPPPVYFVQGAPLPEGFPAGLIVEENVVFEVAIVSPDVISTQNLSTSTRNMMERETVRWNSDLSVDALGAAYESYFSKNGWTVDNKSESPDGKSLGMRATKGTVSVIVSLSSRPDGTLTTVEYKAK